MFVVLLKKSLPDPRSSRLSFMFSCSGLLCTRVSSCPGGACWGSRPFSVALTLPLCPHMCGSILGPCLLCCWPVHVCPYASTVISQLRENAVLHAGRRVPLLPAVGFRHRDTLLRGTLFQQSPLSWNHCNQQGSVPQPPLPFLLRSFIPGSSFFYMSDFISCVLGCWSARDRGLQLFLPSLGEIFWWIWTAVDSFFQCLACTASLRPCRGVCRGEFLGGALFLFPERGHLRSFGCFRISSLSLDLSS